jgi:hypothetical protein
VPRPLDLANYLCGYPPEKKGPRSPARGKGQHGTAGGTAAWPAGLPRPPHLVAGPHRCPPRPGTRKNGSVLPLRYPNQNQNPNQKPTDSPFSFFSPGDYYILAAGSARSPPRSAALRSRTRTTHWWQPHGSCPVCPPAGGPSGGPGVSPQHRGPTSVQ